MVNDNSVNGNVFVGTCSWTDPTLVKETEWYPRRSMTAADRLAFYADNFSIVEADNTYYFPPDPEVARHWAERTPDNFTFDVKAWSLLTGHPTNPKSLWEDLRAELSPESADKRSIYSHHLTTEAMNESWRRFVHGVAPLVEAGKLGAVLFQYPKWFTPKRANREALSELRSQMQDLPVCVEFRSPTWLKPEDRASTLQLLSDLELSLVVVDAPKASGLETVVAATTDLGVVRFHGRSDATWNAKNTTAAERFRYLYNDAEISELSGTVKKLAAQTEKTHALMNNCYQDFGVNNAQQLAEALSSST